MAYNANCVNHPYTKLQQWRTADAFKIGTHCADCGHWKVATMPTLPDNVLKSITKWLT